MKPGFIYIITNKYQTVVYTGVTSNLPQRILEHKEKKDIQVHFQLVMM